MKKDRKKDVNRDVVYGASGSSSTDEVRSGTPAALETSISAGETTLEHPITRGDLTKLEKRVAGVEKRVAGVEKRMAGLEKRMATKEALAGLEKRMATKEALATLEKRMATKKDLAELEKRMATKEDVIRLEGEIKRMATEASVAHLRGQMLWVLIVNATMMAAVLAAVFTYIFGGGA